MIDYTKPPTITCFSEYVAAVMTTEVLPDHLITISEAPAWHWRWMHGVIGLVSEQSEVMCALSAVNMAEELGDRFWYHGLTSEALRAACFEHPSDLAFTCPIEAEYMVVPYSQITTMTEADAALCDLSKRLMCYTKKPLYEALHSAAVASVRATRQILDENKLDCITVMQANINKLYARKVDALKKNQQIGDMNRDLANERAVLEKSLSSAP